METLGSSAEPFHSETQALNKRVALTEATIIESYGAKAIIHKEYQNDSDLQKELSMLLHF